MAGVSSAYLRRCPLRRRSRLDKAKGLNELFEASLQAADDDTTVVGFIPTQTRAALSDSLVQPLASTDFELDVALVGLGYVGLPTALAFHAAGGTVLGLDVSQRRRDEVARGDVDLVGSDHERLREALLDPGRFLMTGDPFELTRARVVIIAVPTPVDDHLLPDLEILRNACAQVVQHVRPGQVIILTSTTYVGSTADMLVAPLMARGFRIGEDVHVAFSPERIDPGNDQHAHEDVPRVVGGVTPACSMAAREALAVYAKHLHLVSSPAAAEMTKLFENSFRAVNIALANELAEISRTLMLDVVEVIEAAATKPYGFMAFHPGPGVGGHCIPCDPHYLLWQLRSERQSAPVIEHAMKAIAARPGRVVERVRDVLSLNGRGLSGARILVLGVTYKPDVADVRESPALEIVATLARLGAEVAYHDPMVARLRLPDGSVVASEADPARYDADLVVVHTLHHITDVEWLADVPLILDTSYRLRDFPQRFVL